MQFNVMPRIWSYVDENLLLQMSSSCDVDNLIGLFELFDDVH